MSFNHQFQLYAKRQFSVFNNLSVIIDGRVAKLTDI